MPRILTSQSRLKMQKVLNAEAKKLADPEDEEDSKGSGEPDDGEDPDGPGDETGSSEDQDQVPLVFFFVLYFVNFVGDIIVRICKYFYQNVYKVFFPLSIFQFVSFGFLFLIAKISNTLEHNKTQ